VNAADWIALLSPAGVIAGAAVVGTSKLTRIACAVEQLKESMLKVADKVDDHERRITKGGL
jgi:hypothetical protein